MARFPAAGWLSLPLAAAVFFLLLLFFPFAAVLFPFGGPAGPPRTLGAESWLLGGAACRTDL